MKPNQKTIYLVPTDYEGGQLTYTWCDCPAPGEGMDPADAIKYVRADLVPESNAVLAERIADLTRQNSELVAQVEWAREIYVQLTNSIARDLDSGNIIYIANEKLMDEFDSWADSKPAQCLAEHDVEVIKAAYKDYRRKYIGQGISVWFGGYINKLRQQAKENAGKAREA